MATILERCKLLSLELSKEQMQKAGEAAGAQWSKVKSPYERRIRKGQLENGNWYDVWDYPPHFNVHIDEILMATAKPKRKRIRTEKVRVNG